jgi:DNA-binding winged helix-turn-helix (wHTH) protein
LDPSCVLPRVARFDVFEVDLRSGELRTHGSKTRLQDKPLQILSLLLEHPGEVVTREELQRRLWPDGVIVDFEHSINTAVKRLREALDVGAGEKEHQFRRFDEQRSRRRGGGTTLQ